MGADLTQLAADMTRLRTAMSQSPTFAGARPETTQSVRQALQVCLNDLGVAITVDELVLGTYPDTVGGVTAGVSGDLNALVFMSFLTFASQEVALVDMRSFLERMQANIDLGGTTSSD